MATFRKENGDLKVTFRTFLFGIVVAGGITASHFTGLSESKEYTNDKVETVELQVEQNLDAVKKDLTDIKVQVGKVEQILVERYGQPKGGGYATEN